MDKQRVLLIVFLSASFLTSGLIAAALGASVGFSQFTQTEQSLLMLILPCCGLPLVVTGSSITITASQWKAPNTQTFIRMCGLGLLITSLLTFGIVLLVASYLG